MKKERPPRWPLLSTVAVGRDEERRREKKRKEEDVYSSCDPNQEIVRGIRVSLSYFTGNDYEQLSCYKP